ncbi:putative nucleoside-diphosphate kinase [Helianthus annuus]|nr:putative nucleoside-diphosphate kinase [Helianthus annuus]
MVLEKVNAIADWRTLIGPTDARKAKITHPDRLLVLLLRLYIIVVLLFYRNILLLLCSIRAMCGEDLERNCVHGSDSRESAAREISFFFPHLLSGEISLSESLLHFLLHDIIYSCSY